MKPGQKIITKQSKIILAKQGISFRQHRTELWNCILAVLMGLLVGYKTIPPFLVGAIDVVLMSVCIVSALQYNLVRLFSILPYICFSEIFVRANVPWLPYLSVQYLFIAVFLILLISPKLKRINHSKAFTLLLIFTIFEIINGVRAERSNVFRSIAIQSIALLIPVIWASLTVLTPVLINRLFYNFKLAVIYLAAIVVVAHIKGEVEYVTFSSREASNGLAPVQLSGYLGFGCVLFFFTIMDANTKNKWLSILCLAFTATVMILTFSRGGLYFLAVVAAVYLFFNRAKMGNYFKFIILLPIAYFIYYLVSTQTGGKIEERYKQEGASNRDVLVSIGFEIFADEPVIGVGTSNYAVEIKRRNLFSEESGAHNEFVRAAAEHGVIGIISYWGFFLFLISEILARKRIEKHYGVYFVILFSLISIHNGLKISVQPVILMLAVGMPSLIKRKVTNVVAASQLARAS